MAQYTEFRARSFKAGEDMRTMQYYFVKLDSTQNVVLHADDDDAAVTIGILKNAPNVGEVAEVVLCGGVGTMKVCAYDTSIKIGSQVGVQDSDGRAIACTTGGDLVFGIALEEATAQNDIIEIVLCRYYHK
jgi:hypothetical protein